MNPLPFGKKMRQDGVLTDVVFVVEDVKFAAHKAILASCSPVFCAMFSTEMEESSTNTVNLKDTKPDVFSDFLDFIYTRDTMYLMQHIKQMMYLADKYDIDFVAKACDELIGKTLTEQNVVDYLFDAHLYKRSKLKAKIYVFIKKHKRAVRASNSWEKLANDLELFEEMLQTLVKDSSEAQPSPSNVTWTVKNKDDKHEFKASVFENGNVYRFIVERYTSTTANSLFANDTAYQHEKIRIGRIPPYYADVRGLPLTMKLWCRCDGAIRWESTVNWTWAEPKGKWAHVSEPKEFSVSKERILPYPFEISFSLEKTPSSPVKFFRGVSGDAKLTIGDTDILVHKSLLAEKSKFFADLFGRDPNSEKYPIEGVSVKTLDTLVDYMYCPHQFPKNENVDVDLLRGAKKFQLQDLFNYCTEVLKGLITVKNVAEVYAAAKEFGLTELEAYVDKFIATNSNYIVKTGKWLDFQRFPELLEKLFRHVFDNHQ